MAIRILNVLKAATQIIANSELVLRLKNVHEHNTKLTLRTKALQKKAMDCIESDGIILSEVESTDIENVMELHTSNGTDLESNMFQKLLWEQQKQYNALNRKRQMKWHPLIIRFALSLHYASRSAYSFVAESGFLSLPSERTLRDYTHWCDIKNGVHLPIIQELSKETMSLAVEERLFGLILDEMTIKSGIVFNKSAGEMIGFVDLGSVNHEMDSLAESLTAGPCKRSIPKLSDHMLSFMVRPVYKPCKAYVIASYASLDLCGHTLYAIIWEVIEALELNGMQVISITCDGISSNRKFLNYVKPVLEVLHIKQLTLLEGTVSFIFFCDPPHLLKTARNCFANSHAHSHSRQLEVCNIMYCFQFILNCSFCNRRMESQYLGNILKSCS